MRTSAAALICCLLVATLAGATAVAGAPSIPDPEPDGTASSTVAESDGAARVVAESHVADEGTELRAATDTTSPLQSDDNRSRPASISIRIDADGDAHFILAKSFPTGTDAELRAFERLADEYERGEHGDLGFPAYEAAFEAVDEESDRDMELIDDGRHVIRENGVGRLEYRFTWTDFAEVGEESVTVGNAFAAGGNVWLELYDGQRLVIQAPDGYDVATSPPGPEIEDNALIWTGPISFSPGDLTVTFQESAGASSSFPATLLLGLGIAFLLVGLLAVVWVVASRRSGDATIPDTPILDASVKATILDVLPASISDSGVDTPGTSVNAEEGNARGPEATSEEAGAINDTEPSAAPEPAAATGEAVDPELLSDEERVEHLLEENGGRMKQANIVSETGWSNAKVSQLLSRMDEEERVDKLRIGRENLITLPEVDVTDRGDRES